MGCCCSSPLRSRNRDTEQGWHENEDDPAREMSESDPVETKLELEGAAASAHTLPAELESPIETRQQAAEADEPPPYSPGTTTQPVVMNREPRISVESMRSIQVGRASEDSGFEKMEQGIAREEPVEYDNRKYRGVVL